MSVVFVCWCFLVSCPVIVARGSALSNLNKSYNTHVVGMNTLLETNIAPENGPSQKRKLVVQPSIFRCYVSFRGNKHEKLGIANPKPLRMNETVIDL